MIRKLQLAKGIHGYHIQSISMDPRLKGEGWNKLTATNTDAVHNPHGSLISRDMCSTNSKNIAPTVTS